MRSGLGQGSCFSFDLPIHLAPSNVIPPKPKTRRVVGLAPGQPPYRILVVEDMLENRQLLVKLMELVGFDVRAVENGQQAIQLWQDWSPHLIWMDMLMPVMDGYKATQYIRELEAARSKHPDASSSVSPPTVIIAITATAFEEQRAAILASGCDAVLAKPFQHHELLDLMEHHLGVRYAYEGHSDEDDRPPEPPQPLTATLLAVMPRDWLSCLYHAALTVDDYTIRALIQQIPPSEVTLQRCLTELVENFRMDTILELTQAAIE